MPISSSDEIGDAREARAESRWQSGDKVQWESPTGWRGGVIAVAIAGVAMVIDYDRRTFDFVSYRNLRRVVPRDDAGNAKW